MIEPADVICSARQLGDVIGVSSRQIERLTFDGVLKTVRSSSKFRGRHYALGDSVQSFLRHERDCLRDRYSRNGSDEYESARARKMAAAALVEESKARQLSGELLDRASTTAAIVNVISIVESRVLSIPSRAARRVASESDPNRCAAMLKQFCRAALAGNRRFQHRKSRKREQTSHVDADTSRP